MYSGSMLNSFAILFVSIVLEALPFVFLGTLVASILHIYVTPHRLQSLIPKNPFLAYLFAGLVGLVMPVCECVSVPLLKQLLKKGVPLGVGITFMASAPIVNPLVMASTRFAFSHSPHIFWWRILGGFVSAIVVGWLFSLLYAKTSTSHPGNDIESACDHHEHHIGVMHHGFSHFLKEFTTVCGYLILGAFLAAVAKLFLPVSWVNTLTSNVFLEIVLLQLLAFGLSLCSEADAFIARTFQGMFSDASILGFLIFGPMIDFKNTLMLRMILSWKHIMLLIGVILFVTGMMSVLFMYMTT